MGIENRDYIRNSGTSDWAIWSSTFPQGCKWLIILNIVIFLLQIFITQPAAVPDLTDLAGDEDIPPEMLEEFDHHMPHVSVVQEWFELETGKVLQGQVWRVITAAFCHSPLDIFHILFNMLFLWWFGCTLERMYGTKEFVCFYLLTALAGSFAYIGLDLVTGDRVPALGASGAVMGVVMLYALHFPREQIRFMFFLPIEIRWLVLLYVIYDLHPVLLALAGMPVYSGIANAAHLGGLAFGLLYWKQDLRVSNWFGKISREPGPGGGRKPKKRSNPGPTSGGNRHQPANTPDPFKEEVDRILQKLHDHGKESLTDEENATLIKASQQWGSRD